MHKTGNRLLDGLGGFRWTGFGSMILGLGFYFSLGSDLLDLDYDCV